MNNVSLHLPASRTVGQKKSGMNFVSLHLLLRRGLSRRLTAHSSRKLERRIRYEQCLASFGCHRQADKKQSGTNFVLLHSPPRPEHGSETFAGLSGGGTRRRISYEQCLATLARHVQRGRPGSLAQFAAWPGGQSGLNNVSQPFLRNLRGCASIGGCRLAGSSPPTGIFDRSQRRR